MKHFQQCYILGTGVVEYKWMSESVDIQDVISTRAISNFSIFTFLWNIHFILFMRYTNLFDFFMQGETNLLSRRQINAKTKIHYLLNDEEINIYIHTRGPNYHAEKMHNICWFLICNTSTHIVISTGN